MNYLCPDCGGGFEDFVTEYTSTIGLIHKCPWCGYKGETF